MVIQDITKFLSMKTIETKQCSPLHGEPSITLKGLQFEECRCHISAGNGFSFCKLERCVFGSVFG